MSHGLFSANKLQFSLIIVSGAYEGLCFKSLLHFELLHNEVNELLAKSIIREAEKYPGEGKG